MARDLHSLDLMNDVPDDGEIPRDIVALAMGCTCYGDEHVEGGCSTRGKVLGINVEAWRAEKARADTAEARLAAFVVGSLQAVADAASIVEQLHDAGGNGWWLAHDEMYEALKRAGYRTRHDPERKAETSEEIRRGD